MGGTARRRKIRAKRRPSNGKFFSALFVGEGGKTFADLEKMLAAQGTQLANHWKPSDSRGPIYERTIPQGVEIVIIDPGPSLSQVQRKRLDHIARQHNLFVVSDQSSPRGICMRLEDWGYEATPLELQEAFGAVEPAAPPPVEIAPPEETEMSRPLPSIVPCKNAKEAGALVQRLRELKDDPETKKPPMTRKSLGAALGVSGSYVAAIEGAKCNPANNVCLAIERLLGIPTNTLPRLAKRENHRINTLASVLPLPLPPPPAEREPVAVAAPPPAPLPPATPPPTLEEMISRASARDLIAALHALQQRLDEVGLERVEMTPLRLGVDYAPRGQALMRAAPSAEVAKLVRANLLTLATVERMHIYRVLEACEGNLSAAAQVLGLHRRSLQRKLHGYRRKAAAARKLKTVGPAGRRQRRGRAEVGIERIVELAQGNPLAVMAELQRRVFR